VSKLATHLQIHTQIIANKQVQTRFEVTFHPHEQYSCGSKDNISDNLKNDEFL